MSVRMSVCVFSIEFQTAGWIWMKFGTEVVLEGGKVLGGGLDLVPSTPRYRVRKGVWGPLEPQPCILAKPL